MHIAPASYDLEQTTMTAKTDRAYWFKHFRAHAFAHDGRPYVAGQSALGAWQSAKAQIYFRAKLKADCAIARKRSKAAKKAAATRRANRAA